MIVANVSVLPLGKGESLSALVSMAVDEADKSGLNYRLTAMGTILEGEWDAVMRVIKRMRDRVLKRSSRVYLVITVDDRKDRRRRLEAKVEKVERTLSKKLRK